MDLHLGDNLVDATASFVADLEQPEKRSKGIEVGELSGEQDAAEVRDVPTILVKPNYHLFPCETVEDGGTAGRHCLPAEFRVGRVVDPGENLLAGKTRGCDALLESDAGNESPLYGGVPGGQDSRGLGRDRT